jgi:hypothetical protein
MNRILTLILLTISLNIYSQKRIHGVILDEWLNYKKGIEVYWAADSSNFTVSNKYGEYKIRVNCDTCFIVFRQKHSFIADDSIKVYNYVLSSAKTLNYVFADPKLNVDWWYINYIKTGFLSNPRFAPYGFYLTSNYLPHYFWLSYGLSYTSNLKDNKNYKAFLKYKFQGNFHDRTLSFNSEWFDFKTENFKLARYKFEYSSNFKFFYYKIGTGIYTGQENFPFLVTSVDLPIRKINSNFLIESDWNTSRFDYHLVINSKIWRFLLTAKYTSLIDLKFFELGLGYNINLN